MGGPAEYVNISREGGFTILRAEDKILVGDVLEKLKLLPDKSVHCIVTSPPYYMLRDYGTATWMGGDSNCKHFRHEKNNNPDAEVQTRATIVGGSGDAIYRHVCGKCGAVREDRQIGLEETPDLYIEKMVAVFKECYRVLRDDGTLWLNIGDTYAAYWGDKYGNAQSMANTRENIGDGIAICVTCGRTKGFKQGDCGHFVGREEDSTRFMIENTGFQCRYCNRYKEGSMSLLHTLIKSMAQGWLTK